MQLQRAYLLLDVAEATLADRERIYALTRDRNVAGIDSRLELKQAESALPAARELIAQLDERIALTRNQIAALMGAGPDRGLAIARPTADNRTPIALPSTVPAELHWPPAGCHRATLARRSSAPRISRRPRPTSIRT